MTLLDPSNDNDRRAIINLANSGFRNSTYTLVGGLPSNEYFDVDQVGLGAKFDGLHWNYDKKQGKKNLDELVQLMVRAINDICKSHQIDRLAFISGEVGPTGVLLVKDALTAGCDLPGLIVLPWKRLDIASTKGASVRSGERFLVVSDVATEGETIASAVRKLLRLGGKVPAALVVLDREQGATENLRTLGINLFSILSVSALNEIDRKDLAVRPAVPPKEKRSLDLGGLAST